MLLLQKNRYLEVQKLQKMMKDGIITEEQYKAIAKSLFPEVKKNSTFITECENPNK